MIKFLPIISVLLLTSCTNTTTSNEPVVPPMSSIPVVSTSNDASIIVSQSGNISVSSGSSQPSLTTTTGANSIGQILSSDTKKLIELQKEKGPNALLEINCSKYDAEGKKFCTSQQALVKKFNEETITWEETLKKGPDYIKTFDCKKITNEFGQKYCNEYQANITVEVEDTNKK